MLALSNRDSDIRHATREYFRGLTVTIEEAIRMEKRKEFLQTQTDDHTLSLLMVALFSGLGTTSCSGSARLDTGRSGSKA